MKGVILAAGKGSRLEPLTYSIPKEMVHVCGRPLLQHAIDMFKAGGVENIIVIVGNNKAAVFDYLKDGKWTGVDVSYRFQTELEGVASAIHKAKPLIDENEVFAVTFGDEIIEPKDKILNEMKIMHGKTGAKCVIGLSPVTDPQRYGIAKIDESGRVLEIFEKPSKPTSNAEAAVRSTGLRIKAIFHIIPPRHQNARAVRRRLSPSPAHREPVAETRFPALTPLAPRARSA